MVNFLLETILALTLGILPSLFWLNFYLKKDPRPEPKKAILTVFLLGAFFTIPAASLELFYLKFFNGTTLIALVVFAFIEEAAKFLATEFWVPYTRFFDEKTDPFFYMITAAMGFALVENILTLFSNLTGSHELVFFPIITTGLFRFLGATFLHSLASGILGFFWAYAILRERESILVFGFFAAVLLHSLFNFAIISMKARFFDFIFAFLILGLVAIGLLYKKLVYKNY